MVALAKSQAEAFNCKNAPYERNIFFNHLLPDYIRPLCYRRSGERQMSLALEHVWRGKFLPHAMSVVAPEALLDRSKGTLPFKGRQNRSYWTANAPGKCLSVAGFVVKSCAKGRGSETSCFRSGIARGSSPPHYKNRCLCYPESYVAAAFRTSISDVSHQALRCMSAASEV